MPSKKQGRGTLMCLTWKKKREQSALKTGFYRSFTLFSHDCTHVLKSESQITVIFRLVPGIILPASYKTMKTCAYYQHVPIPSISACNHPGA